MRPTPGKSRAAIPPVDPLTLMTVDEDHERTLRLLSQAEGLLRLGKPDAAGNLAGKLPQSGPHARAAMRLRCWASLLARDHEAVTRLLEDEELGGELLFLRGAARWRAGDDRAVGDLRQLWWGEPDGVWGLAAVRELAHPPVADSSMADTSVADTATVHHADIYTASEKRALSHLPAATLDTRGAEGAALRLLELVRSRGPGRGLLAAEIQHAIGVHQLQTEKFTEATKTLRRALAWTPNIELARVIQLRLGEAERRRGSYQSAQKHFDQVANIGIDRFSDEALALAGQMAIEYRRYSDARHAFQAQLVRNPVGPARHTALWGLGWVAFRTGDFRSARRFFSTLYAEAPFGEDAPRALYWGARALEERGQRERAAEELAALEIRFPLDYYAYRARAVRGTGPLPDTIAALATPPIAAEVQHLEALVQSGMNKRAREGLGRLRSSLGRLGPDALRTVEEVAVTVGAQRHVDAIRRVRFSRFPDDMDAFAYLESRFPEIYTRRLEQEASKQRVDLDLPAAVVLQESGFSPRAVSPVGALGLMQLMPATARDLLNEENRRHQHTTEDILDASTNMRLGVRYLSRMLRAFGRRPEYAIAAYNAGPGAVTRWRQARGDLPADIFVEEIPYAETRNYVRRVIAGWQNLHYLREMRQAEQPSAIATATVPRSSSD